MNAGPPPQGGHVVTRAEVVESRLRILLFTGETLLRRAGTRAAGHQQTPRLEVIALGHRRALCHRSGAAESIEVVVTARTGTRLAADDAVLPDQIEVPG